MRKTPNKFLLWIFNKTEEDYTIENRIKSIENSLFQIDLIRARGFNLFIKAEQTLLKELEELRKEEMNDKHNQCN